MSESINERLFEQLMRTPHMIRKTFREADRSSEADGFGCGADENGGNVRPAGSRAGETGNRENARLAGSKVGETGNRENAGPAGDEAMEGLHDRDGRNPGRRHGRGQAHAAFARERLLSIISRYENGVRQKELTGELKINPSSVSEFISKLENDGYVERKADPNDGRATLIMLTESGRVRAAGLEVERREKLAGVFEPLTQEEKEQLIGLLEKLTAGL